MFRTDINHLLQSIDSHFFYKFMEYVSFMGSIFILMLTILILISGINFRKGYLVLNILGWGVLITLGAKNYYNYPRPIAVDATLENFNTEKTMVDYSDMQPTGFFEVFSDELLAITRESDIGRYGFPSGHAMIITSIWIGMALLFDKRWLWVLSISMVVLTIFSRMYLGVHYLGDVVGGLAIGLLLAFSFHYFYKKVRLKEELKMIPKQYLFFLLPLMLVLFSGVLPGFQAGTFIGFNLALLLILNRWQEPVLAKAWGKRVANILLLVVIYFAGYYFTRQLPLAKNGFSTMAVFLIVNFATIMVTFYIGKKLKFYTWTKRKNLSTNTW